MVGGLGLAAINREKPLDGEKRKRVCRRFVPAAIYERYMGVRDLENVYFRDSDGNLTGTKTRIDVGESDFILKIKRPGEEWITVDLANHEAMKEKQVRVSTARRLPEQRQVRPDRGSSAAAQGFQ